MYFLIILVYSANFFSFWSKYIEQDCQNWNLRVHRKSWKKIKFFEKIVVVLIFFKNDQKSFNFWRKLFGRVVNTAFDVGIVWFWEVLFAHWANPFRHSVEDFPLGMSEKRSNFWSFPDIEQKNFDFLSKKLKQGCQNCFLHVYRNSLKDLVSWKKSWISSFFFGHWAKKFCFFVSFFQWGCQ